MYNAIMNIYQGEPAMAMQQLYQTHDCVSAAKKTRNWAPHTSVLFMQTMI